MSMLVTGVIFQHYLVSYGVGVRYASSILAFSIIMEDKLLLTFLNALPVSLEQYVEEGITPKHKQCRHGACGWWY